MAESEGHLDCAQRHDLLEDSRKLCETETALGPTPPTNIPTEIAQAESSDETTADDGLLRITVTGTRTPRTIQSSPTTITVIDADDFNRLLIRDISDLIRYEPGVSVRNNLQTGQTRTHKTQRRYPEPHRKLLLPSPP